MRNGRKVTSLYETVTITGDRIDSSGQPTTYEVEQSMIILPDRSPRITPEGYTVENSHFIGNLSPPNFQIRENDRVTRSPRGTVESRGASNDNIQVLTVEFIQSPIDGIQQLQLRDRTVR